MNTHRTAVLLSTALASTLSNTLVNAAADSPTEPAKTVRVAACQARPRMVDFRLAEPAAVLAAVDRNLDQLEKIVASAAEKKCDALAFPEDTLGLLNWCGMNEAARREVLTEAVGRMLERFGRAAADRKMSIVCASDAVEADGAVSNTAFLLGPDGKEIGRYRKVCPTWAESGSRRRGAELPVFAAPGLGTVGMLICYDMVMPETSRALALRGAEVIFVPTMGGAAIGDEEIGLAAMRVRAVDSFVWLVVAQRGSGAMVISPQGKIVARAEGPDGLAIADIDPLGGREGGDSANHQRDMRARLFRERNPAAFGILTDPEPPVLAKVPLEISREEAARIASRMLTVGEEEFKAACALSAAGKKQEAVEAFGRLCREYRDSWIDTASARWLRQLGAEPPAAPQRARGIAADHPRDQGIAEDPRVLFAEDFESGALEEMKKRWTDAKDPAGAALSLVPRPAGEGEAGRCLQVSATPGQNDGGYLYKRLARGVEKLHARFYVKFAEDPDYLHHFVSLGGYQPATSWPQGGAGERPKGDDRIYVGIEPHGNYGQFPAPGAWSFYNYWHEMKISADGKYWGNATRPETPLLPPRGRWQCVEVMVKLNSKPEKADGELALWLDGQEAMRIGPGTRRGPWSGMGFALPKEGGEPFEGFRWRTSEELKLNWFWLLHYVTPYAARQNRKDEPARPNRVWFDDVVLATEYIGPLSAATSK